MQTMVIRRFKLHVAEEVHFAGHDSAILGCCAVTLTQVDVDPCGGAYVSFRLNTITKVGLTFGFVPTGHLTQNGRTGGSIGILIYSYIRGGPNWNTRAQSRLLRPVATPRIWQILIALFVASGSGAI